MTETIIAVQNLVKTFDDDARAVRDVSFVVGLENDADRRC